MTVQLNKKETSSEITQRMQCVWELLPLQGRNIYVVVKSANNISGQPPLKSAELLDFDRKNKLSTLVPVVDHWLLRNNTLRVPSSSYQLSTLSAGGGDAERAVAPSTSLLTGENHFKHEKDFFKILSIFYRNGKLYKKYFCRFTLFWL